MNSVWIAFAISSAVPLVAARALDVSTSHKSALQNLLIGVLTAVPVVMVEHKLLALLRDVQLSRGWQNVIIAFVIAGFVEETVRYLAIEYTTRYRRPTRAIDVVWTAVWISIGFAALENAAFVAVSAMGRGNDVVETALARVLFPTFMHVFSGIILTAAVLKLLGGLSFAAVPAAVLFHGAYDWIALSLSGPLRYLVIFLIAGLLLAGMVVRMARLHDAGVARRGAG